MRLTPSQALARLTPNRAPSKSGKANTKPLELVSTVGISEDDIYLFGGDGGGILCPADDGLPAILGTWEEGGEIPPAMEWWLQGYAAEVEWWQAMGESINDDTPQMTKAPAAPRQSIPMLMTTKWSQKSPYNDTIVFNGQKCVTGCNATAAAQVIYYWSTRGYHRGCTATTAYVTSTNKYEVDALPPLASFDYIHLVEKPKTDKEKKAVQDLMVYLGRTMHSNYTPTATGAYTHKLADHFKNAIRLCDTATAIWASKLGDKEFERRIYADILCHRPVILGGHMPKGGGHAFVVDGYDADTDMYHVNWGWGGSYNGWFKLSALNPSKYTFNANKVAIVGVEPTYDHGDVNGDGDTNIADVMQVIQDAQKGNNDPKADINYDGKVTITDVQLLIDKILGKTKT